MSREYYIYLFRTMWRDMYEEIVSKKHTIIIPEFKPHWLQNKGLKFRNNCPLCEYAHKINCSGKQDNLRYCEKCPIVWLSENDRYMCEYLENEEHFDGLWVKASNSKDWVVQAALCLMISKLPEKEK